MLQNRELCIKQEWTVNIFVVYKERKFQGVFPGGKKKFKSRYN